MVQLFVPGRKDDVKEHIKEFEDKLSQFKSKAVSYTHLTLPTKA